jgi:hypothetical protein
MYKEAGPEASVQLRNLTVVERASEQLMDECFGLGWGKSSRHLYFVKLDTSNADVRTVRDS